VHVKRFMLWIRKTGVRKYILIIGLSLLFFWLIVFPSATTHALQASPTMTSQPAPTILPTELPTQTPEPQAGGEVGANAGLVCGAVVLVIIIIAGLFRSARWMQFRGKGETDEGE
jgi:hypothetical protein